MKEIKVVMWGAGVEAERNIANLPVEWHKLAIVDSNPEKDTYLNDIPIITKEKLNSIEFDYIVITSSKYIDEIKDDIREMGISMLKVIDGARCNKVLTQQEHFEYFNNLIKEKELQYASEYVFENRSSNQKKLLYILSGYKPELWDDVSSRIKKFIPDDIDVCILSSGKYVEKLSECAKENGWSYLSTFINDVAIIQNIVIDLFKHAKYIFKMDEDIFVTNGCFEKMLAVLEEAQKQKYKIGFVGPMIPLHTNGHLFLESFGLEKDYKEHIGYQCVPGGRWTNRGYGINSEIAKYLWSVGNLDDLNRQLEDKGNSFVITPIKYAICFILFEREVYEDMGGFNIVPETRSAGMNGDEGQLMEYCMHHCKCIAVACDTLCGHFSYPWQEKDMIEFRNMNRQYFNIRE